jgi:hypothetical protein
MTPAGDTNDHDAGRPGMDTCATRPEVAGHEALPGRTWHTSHQLVDVTLAKLTTMSDHSDTRSSRIDADEPNGILPAHGQFPTTRTCLTGEGLPWRS